LETYKFLKAGFSKKYLEQAPASEEMELYKNEFPL